MEKLILQCKVNEDEQIEAKMPTLLDEFISLNEEKSVSKTLEEVLSFTAHAPESALSSMMDINSEISDSNVTNVSMRQNIRNILNTTSKANTWADGH